MRVRTVMATTALTVMTAAAVIGTAPPAWAHKHPTPVELDSPGVVFVETSAQVQISLIEHNRLGRHIGLIQRTYSPVLATGSGFAVDPTGAVVTSASVVNPDLSRAAVFAVNTLFHERYGSSAPLPSDPFTQQTISDLPDDPVNQRLQRCYQPNTADNTGGCVIAMTREVRVYPYVTSQQAFGALPAEVLAPKPGETGDVAVLRVGASSMPTVNLAQSAAGAVALSVLGFTGTPGTTHQLQTIDAHLVKAGAHQLKHDEFFNPVFKGLTAGMAGGPLVAEKGQVIGFLATPGGAAEPTLVDAAAVRTALKSVGVVPQRGPVDAIFEDASHSFKNSLFSASIPSLQKTLQLYPGHFIAAQDLKIAQAKRGTTADLTGRSSSIVPTAAGGGGASSGLSTRSLVLIIAGGVLLLAIVVGLVLLLQRRRRRGAAPPAKPPSRAPGQTRPPEQRRPSEVQAGTTIARPEQPTTGRASRGAGDPIRFVEPSPSAAERSSVGSRSEPLATASAAQPTAYGAGRAASPAPRSSALPDTGVQPASPPSQPVARFCTHCGQPMAPGHRFCGRCGYAADNDGHP